jgi:glutaredoxin
MLRLQTDDLNIRNRMIVTLYSRPGCHLCEELRAELDEMQPELGFKIEEIDITHDAALFERYRYEIPVLLMNGEEIGRGRIDIAMVRERTREGPH